MTDKLTNAKQFIEDQKLNKIDSYPVINNDFELEAATGNLKRIKFKSSEIEEKKKAIVGPINESLKAIRALFKEPEDILKANEQQIKKSIIEYDNKKDAEKAPLPEPGMVAPLVVKTKIEGVQVRTRYIPEISDIMAVIKAAYEGNEQAIDILTIDTGRLNKLVTQHKTMLNIPGVTVSKVKSVAASGS